jgi:DNA-binding CsgD family transcriptional regulator
MHVSSTVPGASGTWRRLTLLQRTAARLFISERTIVSHVRNIMNKPGFSSRAQIAGWMTAPDP